MAPAEILELKQEYAVYAGGSGRCSVAGMANQSLDLLSIAIAVVLASGV